MATNGGISRTFAASLLGVISTTIAAVLTPVISTILTGVSDRGKISLNLVASLLALLISHVIKSYITSLTVCVTPLSDVSFKVGIVQKY